MAYNKTKHLNAAQKYLQQGKMPQAILEYQQILKNEPKDQVTLMTLGDLFVRQGDTFQALEYFERLATIFLNDGFTTKAIAIYKKVAKLAPEENRPLERLAELYVQQGVLSEARPLYLQLAEAQLKAGRQPQAVALLQKLLEADPDNLRVQVRMAELQLSMGQQKESIDTFHAVAEKLLEQGDHAETIRLADRILQLDPSHQATFQLKVRTLSAAGKGAEAGQLMETLPDREDGGETTSKLLTLYLENGKLGKAVELAGKVYARDPKQYAAAQLVASALMEAGEFDRAQSVLGLIRDSVIDSGDHESLAQALTRLSEGEPGQLVPLEWLVDLYGRASDSFRLPDALAQLAQAYERAGDDTKALATYEKLLERTPEDETTRRKYMRLRTKTGLEQISGEIAPAVKLPPTEESAKTPVPVPVPSDPTLDDETQRYVTQALTDVDLFSSYGLAQKAIDLLESVLDRAPRHAPVLERLLDLSVGSGNNRRVAELATVLEDIAKERNDRAGMERFAEFKRRFQPAAASPVTAEKPAKAAPPAAAAPPEFAVPTIQAELDEPVEEAAPPAIPAESKPAPVPAEAESAVHEVDLSDEWAALSQQLETVMQEEPEAVVPEPVAAKREVKIPAPVLVPAEAAQSQAEAIDEAPGFDLELQPVDPAGAVESQTSAGDSLIADLAQDLESFTSSLGITETPAPASMQVSAPPPAQPPSRPAAAATSGNGASKPAAPAGLDGPLGDLFEEFRSELGETREDEDLETHYNLGIAYREMGLLEEAISEFQKVANSADKGPAFRYAMQCSTLLGLAFMEKGQPAIAAIWYERALKTPGLDQESILALRYDLGVAQELAGDARAAFSSFSQVYAMNIDYRDVSERIALLAKAR